MLNSAQLFFTSPGRVDRGADTQQTEVATLRRLHNCVWSNTSCFVLAPLFSEAAMTGDKSQIAQFATAEPLAVMLIIRGCSINNPQRR